jgi:type I restriction enzyme S subunit
MVQDHAYPSLNLQLISGSKVPTPALPAQRRIVAILDGAFEGIATAKANAEKNLQSARELLGTVRRNAFHALALEHGSTALGLCCDFENGDRGKNYPGKKHRVVSGVPFINAGHLSEGRVDFSDMDYITAERFALLGNGKIKSQDVLFCLRGSLGKFAWVNDLDEGAIASSLVILRPRNVLTTEYLLEFLASPQCADQISTHQGGAAQPNLGAKDLKLFELPLPPIETQTVVAGHLSDLAVETSNLRALHERKLAALDELKKSLLHQAFSGAL